MCVLKVAQALGRELVVAWAKGEHCSASFHDLFDEKHLPSGTRVVEVTKGVLVMYDRRS